MTIKMKTNNGWNIVLRSIVYAIIAVAAAVLTLGMPSDHSVQAHDGDETCSPECRVQLARVRAATAKYHDINEALLDGYTQVSPCVALPTGPAMGIHYGKVPRMQDGVLNIEEPEILLYQPESDGDLRLVAVEYMIPRNLVTELPQLFGHYFHSGPMNTYTLHAWIWRNNPSGMFEDFNPNVTCSAN
ncbi:MAG TPA: hypothetical protein VFZ23_17810 [Pyrinomonadaceae bacterium]